MVEACWKQCSQRMPLYQPKGGKRTLITVICYAGCFAAPAVHAVLAVHAVHAVPAELGVHALQAIFAVHAVLALHTVLAVHAVLLLEPCLLWLPCARLEALICHFFWLSAFVCVTMDSVLPCIFAPALATQVPLSAIQHRRKARLEYNRLYTRTHCKMPTYKDPDKYACTCASWPCHCHSDSATLFYRLIDQHIAKHAMLDMSCSL